MAKYSFPEPSCNDCKFLTWNPPYFPEERICSGFKGNASRSFHKNDPVTKPPKWCPRRYAKPICRVYNFCDQQGAFFGLRYINSFDPSKDKYLNPSPHHYTLRTVAEIPMKAKAFFDAVSSYEFNESVASLDLFIGDVIEIDDGLKPYFFVKTPYKVVPVHLFDTSKVKIIP